LLELSQTVRGQLNRNCNLVRVAYVSIFPKFLTDFFINFLTLYIGSNRGTNKVISVYWAITERSHMTYLDRWKDLRMLKNMSIKT
jgi:hypothetical protein